MIIQPEVTREDIDVGVPKSCSKCPEAIALSRACGQPMIVGGYGFYRDAGTRISVPLPGEISLRITQFDNGDGMTPHRWPQVEVPDDWVKGNGE